MSRLSATMKIGLFLLLTAAAMLAATPLTARADEGDGGAPAAMSEQEFINLMGDESKGGKENEGGEPGSPMVPAGGEKKDEGKDSDDDQGDGDEEPGKGSDDDDSDDDDDKEEGGKGGDDDEEHPAGDDTDDSDDDDDAEGKGEEGDEEPAGDAKADAEFQKALEAEGANPSLEDIPKAARPLVAKKLRDLEGGFTRATQRLAEERQAAGKFRAEERFRRENPADFIVAMLREKPELSEQVNKIVLEMQDAEGNANSTAVKGHEAHVERARRAAQEAENKAADTAKQAEARIERFITLGRAAARAAGVPFAAGVEEGIAAHLAIHGDITETEIRAIANQKARVFKAATRTQRREASGKYVKDKVGDRKKAPLKVRPGSGSSPAPGGRRLPKNDQEFIEQFTAQG